MKVIDTRSLPFALIRFYSSSHDNQATQVSQKMLQVEIKKMFLRCS